MLNTVFSYWAPTNEEKNIVVVDESCIMYNQLYKSYEFYDDKFPDGFNNIPGFNLIIDKIVDNSQDNSPLKEMDARQSLDCDANLREMRAFNEPEIISKQINRN
jgi:hypothetical protein